MKKTRAITYWSCLPVLLAVCIQAVWCDSATVTSFHATGVTCYEAALRVITALSADQFNTVASGRGIRLQDLQGVLQQQALEAGKNVLGDSAWKNDVQAPYLAGQPVTVRVYPRFCLTLEGPSLNGSGKRELLINECSPALSYLEDPPNPVVPQPLLSASPALNDILANAPADIDLRYVWLKGQLHTILTPLAQWRYKQDSSLLIPYDDFVGKNAFSLKSAPALTQEWIRGLYACAQSGGLGPNDSLPSWDSLGDVTVTPKIILSVGFFHAPFNGKGGAGWGFEL